MYRVANKVDYGDCSSASYDMINQSESFQSKVTNVVYPRRFQGNTPQGNRFNASAKTEINGLLYQPDKKSGNLRVKLFGSWIPSSPY